MRQRGRQPEKGRGRKEGDTESEAGFRLSEPDMGLEHMTHEIVAWAQVGCLTDWATQAPLHLYLLDELTLWPLALCNDIFCILLIFGLKFALSKCSHLCSHLIPIRMEYFFPSLNFQSMWVLKAEVSLLWTTYSWVLFLFLLFCFCFCFLFLLF